MVAQGHVTHLRPMRTFTSKLPVRIFNNESPGGLSSLVAKKSMLQPDYPCYWEWQKNHYWEWQKNQ